MSSGDVTWRKRAESMQFTRFTSAKVQILTQKACTNTNTSSKVQILTQKALAAATEPQQLEQSCNSCNRRRWQLKVMSSGLTKKAQETLKSGDRQRCSSVAALLQLCCSSVAAVAALLRSDLEIHTPHAMCVIFATFRMH
jgi:ABC-type dipeptide/oligopeptide/nickel transport system ATPase subunit